MQFRTNPKNGDQLSVLGYGCMRLGRNEKEAEKLLVSAVEQGINYLDTAYFYAGNEALLGRILQRTGLRDKVKLATKMPQYFVKKPADLDRFFNTELEHLRTDHVDYYLMHTLNSLDQWERLVGFGVVDWIAEKKAAGQIKNIGFSYHGGKEEFRRIVDAYPWEFCMIQYNYLDENHQAGKEGLLYAAGKGLAVMVMEPLQGGRLATGLPQEAQAIFSHAEPKRSPAEWGLRWVWNHPQVTLALSGMSSSQMLEENIRVACDAKPDSLSEKELALFERAQKIIREKTRVPCTGCGYCMPCPFGVEIPMCFSCYNETAVNSRFRAQMKYVTYVGSHGASQCKQCGKCEEHCPQSIPIREKLAEAASALEGFPYKPARAVVGWWLKREKGKKKGTGTGGQGVESREEQAP